MRVAAAAKINLHLRVGRRRADGFHPLLTWMVTAGLFDTLVFTRRPRNLDRTRADATVIELSCDHPSLAGNLAGNLVTRAAAAMADTLRRNGEGSIDVVSAYLIKRIPPGAGLAGGSSDAAATLLALNQLWKADWPVGRLARFSEQFGSDVPFFFHGPSSVCTGRGEIVRPVPAPERCRWAVLMLPDLQVSTPAAYGRFDEMSLGSEEAIADEPDWMAWAKLAAAELLPRLVNDLEPAAFSLVPRLAGLRNDAEQRLGRIVRMSGSGSSLFTLCDTAEEADRLAEQARKTMHVDAKSISLAPTA